jgi:pyruvate ferredoxin oxidoreductase gamma subunit
MFQVRIHGRGGQGVVTAAELLAVAAFDEGRYAQAFPSFGSERMGAPVVSYCRIDDHPIRTREPVMEPDALIIQDVTLIHQVDLFAGLSPDGYLLVNTARTLEELGLGAVGRQLPPDHLANCPATDIALEQLGRPLPNAALIAGFAALTGMLALASVDQAIRQRFPGAVGERNVVAATAAFRHVNATKIETARAAPD